jgi:hypothetical protein
MICGEQVASKYTMDPLTFLLASAIGIPRKVTRLTACDLQHRIEQVMRPVSLGGVHLAQYRYSSARRRALKECGQRQL